MAVENIGSARTAKTRRRYVSPLSAENIMNPDVSLRDKIGSFVAQQGVATVLLFLLIYVGPDAAERAVNRIEQGYRNNAEMLLQVAKQRDETMEKLIAQWKDDRRLLVEILRNDQRAVNALEAAGGEQPAN